MGGLVASARQAAARWVKVRKGAWNSGKGPQDAECGGKGLCLLYAIGGAVDWGASQIDRLKGQDLPTDV